ncbi:MAG: hypothetical protein LBJ37_00105 [Paucimonas sp.]|jgi:hypothetical protein|nr:hypothetical protein [Paucimonas sp.]
MHKIWTTSSPHAILDHSYPTSAATESGCRAVCFKNRLYCVYIDGVPGLGTVKVLHKADGSDWSEPAEVSGITPLSDPFLFVFGEQLHVMFPTTLGSTLLLTLDEASGLFVLTRTLLMALANTPSAAVLAGRLHLFHHVPDSTNLWYCSTTDLKTWAPSVLVKADGVYAVRSPLSPLAITYQRLVHLVYKDSAGGFYLIKFDGVRQWSRAQLLLPDDYPHTPAGAVHNGLVKLVFSQPKADDYALHQYGYDGNVLGPVSVSTSLGATLSPAAAVQDGVLHVLYRSKP